VIVELGQMGKMHDLGNRAAANDPHP
jgi:hypothetical protein